MIEKEPNIYPTCVWLWQNKHIFLSFVTRVHAKSFVLFFLFHIHLCYLGHKAKWNLVIDIFGHWFYTGNWSCNVLSPPFETYSLYLSLFRSFFLSFFCTFFLSCFLPIFLQIQRDSDRTKTSPGCLKILQNWVNTSRPIVEYKSNTCNDPSYSHKESKGIGKIKVIDSGQFFTF